MIRNAIAGIFSITLLYLSSFLGTIFVHGLALPLLLIRPSWFSRFSDSVIGMWLILPTVCVSLPFCFLMSGNYFINLCSGKEEEK